MTIIESNDKEYKEMMKIAKAIFEVEANEI